MLKWPDKDKDEVVDYSIDWSRFLSPDTISAATWFIDDGIEERNELEDSEVYNGLQFVSSNNTETITTARFGLGTNNVRYKVICSVTTSRGLKYERSVFLRIREK